MPMKLKFDIQGVNVSASLSKHETLTVQDRFQLHHSLN